MTDPITTTEAQRAGWMEDAQVPAWAPAKGDRFHPKDVACWNAGREGIPQVVGHLDDALDLLVEAAAVLRRHFHDVEDEDGTMCQVRLSRIPMPARSRLEDCAGCHLLQTLEKRGIA